VASYAYDHRGLRIAKTIQTPNGEQTTYYLYDEGKNLLAELNAQGKLQRQYVYVADIALAVIDGEKPPEAKDNEPLLQTARDFKTVMDGWLSSTDRLTWLHANHLNAPEVATDANGQVIWQAEYAAFGRAKVKTSTSFTLNLRLPGQYEDAETGLHYNRQRYYNPESGSYLTPDPSGAPDGPNRYSYVRYNPLKYVDPDGLVLFAFDGTGNTNNAADLNTLGNGLSNVWRFNELYGSGNTRYVTGVGTRHRDAQYGDIAFSWGGTSTADMGSNYTGSERIARMVQYFQDEADLLTDDNVAMDVDVIGFSRGAAQARDFVNRIIANTTNGVYKYYQTVNGRATQRCQKVNFRFMGLWDTVLSSNVNRGYNLAVPDQFAYVAHAIALNEYRGQTVRDLPDSTGAFPLESIL
jgi:RHS repeat-associated protein